MVLEARFHLLLLGWVPLTALVTCVPREKASEERKTTKTATQGRVREPSPSVGNAAAPSRAADLRSPAASDPRLQVSFRDDFNRKRLGDNWRATSSAWSISNGQLCGEGARNHPVWLARRLPANAVVEFMATSLSEQGDIKAEFWGDGRSAATGQSYDDATSYLTIFGGWQNRFHVLARLDEHASDRREIKLRPDSADFTHRTVAQGRAYHFHVERRDGRLVRWLVDDMELLTYPDARPLSGEGHEHFGFNDWQVRVCFDDLEVTPLED